MSGPAAIWIPLAASLLACVSDVRHRVIPDLLSISLLLAGVLVAASAGGLSGTQQSLLGATVAFMIVLPFSLLGGIGGGDLKLLAAIGAWVGPMGAIQVLFWVALCGMIAAIHARVRSRSSFPYAPSIAAGLAIQAMWPGLLATLVGQGPHG